MCKKRITRPLILSLIFNVGRAVGSLAPMTLHFRLVPLLTNERYTFDLPGYLEVGPSAP
jgi:hypothetical protein